LNKSYALLIFLFLWSSCTNQKVQSMTKSEGIEKATFAGGCFWCMEPPFDQKKGVLKTISGYAGGSELNPNYEQVSSGSTGHLEVIRVEYDPNQVSYEELLDIYWKNVDPTDDGGQFVDRGPQYATAIFYHDDNQKSLAEKSKKALSESGRFQKPIITPIRKLESFYPAEDYHQDYYQKNPIRYKFYRYNSGRDNFLDKKWKR